MRRIYAILQVHALSKNDMASTFLQESKYTKVREKHWFKLIAEANYLIDLEHLFSYGSWLKMRV